MPKAKRRKLSPSPAGVLPANRRQKAEGRRQNPVNCQELRYGQSMAVPLRLRRSSVLVAVTFSCYSLSLIAAGQQPSPQATSAPHDKIEAAHSGMRQSTADAAREAARLTDAIA